MSNGREWRSKIHLSENQVSKIEARLSDKARSSQRNALKGTWVIIKQTTENKEEQTLSMVFDTRQGDIDFIKMLDNRFGMLFDIRETRFEQTHWTSIISYNTTGNHLKIKCDYPFHQEMQCFFEPDWGRKEKTKATFKKLR